MMTVIHVRGTLMRPRDDAFPCEQMGRGGGRVTRAVTRNDASLYE